MSETEYPLWETDKVTDRIGTDHYVTIELLDDGSGAFSVTELDRKGRTLKGFRHVMDATTVTPELFRLTVEHVLNHYVANGMPNFLIRSETLHRIVGLKIVLEQGKARRICRGELHCGAVAAHGPHYHMEGAQGYHCEGWSND